MGQTKFLYDPESECYWFSISWEEDSVRAAVSFKTLQFNFKAVNNPASMRRACILNEGLIKEIVVLKLKKGGLPLIDYSDPEIDDVRQ